MRQVWLTGMQTETYIQGWNSEGSLLCRTPQGGPKEGKDPDTATHKAKEKVRSTMTKYGRFLATHLTDAEPVLLRRKRFLLDVLCPKMSDEMSTAQFEVELAEHKCKHSKLHGCLFVDPGHDNPAVFLNPFYGVSLGLTGDI